VASGGHIAFWRHVVAVASCFDIFLID
jgi:hypothetical protein